MVRRENQSGKKSITVEELQTPSSISKPVVLTLCLLIVVIAYLGIRLHRSFFHDDAYITLRYADQWQAGLGPVWTNSQQVEGYTSFLHLVSLYPLQKAGVQPENSARFIGLGAYLLIWLAIITYSFRTTLSQIHRVTKVVILLGSIPTAFSIIAWSLGGLETSLYTLLTMTTTYWFTTWDKEHSPQTSVTLGVLLGLCVMTRPEATLIVAITLTASVIFNKSLKSPLTMLISCCIVYIPYFVWRWQYYGDVLPNTYYAKLGTPIGKRISDGIYYFHTFLRSAPWIPLLSIACWIYTLVKQTGHRSKGWKYMTSVSIVMTGYVIWTGGDHMPAYRFWVPLIPIYAWFIAHAGTSLRLSSSTTKQMLLPVIVVILSVTQFFVSDERMFNAQRPDPAAAVGKQVGRFISQHFPEGTLIATNSAGAVAYFAPKHDFIDMLGLNDRVIAKRTNVPFRTHWQQFPGHSKGDGKYVLSRNPDYIILGPAEGSKANPKLEKSSKVVWFLSDQELSEDPNFHTRYMLKTAKLSDTLTLTYYQRKQQLN